jgi:CRP-like cAMP-binding protein
MPIPSSALSDVDPVSTVAAKFQSLGMDDGDELRALLGIIRRKATVRRGEIIAGVDDRTGSVLLLLAGVACRFQRLEKGRRHIFAFQYPGDFCDFHRHVFPEVASEISTGAITECSIGVVDYGDVERIIVQFPKLGVALWRATMLDASIFRERVLYMTHRTSLACVSHLLCEQLARLNAIGVSARTIPLRQIDIADAAGLSAVHINRTIQQLRMLGALGRSSRGVKVLNRRRLVEIAKFDGRYLNMSALQSNWGTSIEAFMDELDAWSPIENSQQLS